MNSQRKNHFLITITNVIWDVSKKPQKTSPQKKPSQQLNPHLPTFSWQKKALKKPILSPPIGNLKAHRPLEETVFPHVPRKLYRRLRAQFHLHFLEPASSHSSTQDKFVKWVHVPYPVQWQTVTPKSARKNPRKITSPSPSPCAPKIVKVRLFFFFPPQGNSRCVVFPSRKTRFWAFPGKKWWKEAVFHFLGRGRVCE